MICLGLLQHHFIQQLFFGQGYPLAHLLTIQRPIQDVIFWLSLVPTDQVELFSLARVSLGKHANLIDNFEFETDIVQIFLI